MTPFPLPRPTAPAGPATTTDLDGLVLTHRCSPQVAPFVDPVIERFAGYHASGHATDGRRTTVGFSIWQLRADEDGRLAIVTSDYAGEGDLVDDVTDDLTTALWVEASQADTTARAGVTATPLDVSSGVTFTKAALTVVEKGRPDELVLVRRPPEGEHDSGWLVRTAERSFLRNKEVEILAGLLVGTAAPLVPLLTLPTGTVARVADGRFLGAWLTAAADGTVSESDQQLLDAEGRGLAVPDLETIEEVVDGVTLRARVTPQLAPLAQAPLAGFAVGAAGPLQPGATLRLSYAPFVLEEGAGGALVLTTPDFSSPAAYREATTDDLTDALWASAAQARILRLADLEGRPTPADETVAIQQAALEALVLGEPAPFVMERIRTEPEAQVLDDGTRRSGWMISTPGAATDEERALRNIDAGELQSCDPLFTPYLALPDDALLQFAGGRLHSAHLVDETRLEEVLGSGEVRTLGEALATPGVARQLDLA